MTQRKTTQPATKPKSKPCLHPVIRYLQNATHPSKPAPSATTSATLEEPPSRNAEPWDALAVADAEAPVPVPAPPEMPEMPVGSLGWSAVAVVDSELRLLSDVTVADPVSVVATEVDVKVRIGPPGLVLLTIESVVNGGETAAMAAVGPSRRRM